MTNQPDNALPTYQVVGVSPGQYSTDAAGNPVQGRLVHFKLADGTQDSAFVPNSQWSLDNARAAVEQAVQMTYAVRNLGSTAGS